MILDHYHPRNEAVATQKRIILLYNRDVFSQKQRKDLAWLTCSESGHIQYSLGDPPLDSCPSNAKRCPCPPILQSQPKMKHSVYVQCVFPVYAQQSPVMWVNRQHLVGIACQPL